MTKKQQFIADAQASGASTDEMLNAIELYRILAPAIRVRDDIRVMTAEGTKTCLGLYRLIGRSVDFTKVY